MFNEISFQHRIISETGLWTLTFVDSVRSMLRTIFYNVENIDYWLEAATWKQRCKIDIVYNGKSGMVQGDFLWLDILLQAGSKLMCVSFMYFFRE